MVNRFLYPPIRFQVQGEPELKFRTMTSVKEFFATKFPDNDVEMFFKSFSWKVPSKFVKGKKLEFLQEVQQNVPQVSGERNDEATDQIQMLEKKLKEAEKKREEAEKKIEEAAKKCEEEAEKRKEAETKLEEATFSRHIMQKFCMMITRHIMQNYCYMNKWLCTCR